MSISHSQQIFIECLLCAQPCTTSLGTIIVRNSRQTFSPEPQASCACFQEKREWFCEKDVFSSVVLQGAMKHSAEKLESLLEEPFLDSIQVCPRTSDSTVVDVC